MRIAILTLPLHTNYGGILQAYALQTVLQRMGHEVEVLDTDTICERPLWLMPMVYVKRMLLRLLGYTDKPILLERKLRRDTSVIRRHTAKFIGRYINIRFVEKLTEIKPTDYDCIIVGSDQVWRKPYFCWMWHTGMPDAFLRFTEGWNHLRRVAYAASFGVDNLSEYTSDDINRCKRLVRNFRNVSVREEAGMIICGNIFGIDSELVLDPTMLISRQDYTSLIDQSGLGASPGDMLCYILDPDDRKNKIISMIAKERGLTPFNMNALVDDIRIPAEKRIQPPVEAWLRGFRDSKFIVTDSFHACVFSIIFEKPFIAVGNTGRGLARFTSLLSKFGLGHRLVSEGDFDAATLPDIDWPQVRGALADNQARSIDFLTKSLQ